MTAKTKWCPRCRREIPEPPTNPTSTYAKFWRDKLCYICDSPLLPLAESPTGVTPAGTYAVATTPAEAQSTPSAQPPAAKDRYSDHDADVATSVAGSSLSEAQRLLDNGAQARRIRCTGLVHSALVKYDWLEPLDLDDPNFQSNLRWHGEQADLVAIEALRAFPERVWGSNDADDRFEQFIDLAVMNRKSNRLHSFANSAELFLAGHRADEYRAGYRQTQPAPPATIVSNRVGLGQVERLARVLTRLVARVANAGLVITCVLDGLLNASGRLHWESVRHWPIVRSYNPERYEPYIGLTGGWSPLGSSHNALALGLPFGLMLALSAFLQWAAGRAIGKDGLSVAEKLVWIRPWGRVYFALLHVATIGSVIAMLSPELFTTSDAVPLAAQLALGASVSIMLAHDNSTLLTEDLIEDLAKVSQWK